MANFDGVSALDLLIKKVNATNNDEVAEIDSQLEEILKESEAVDVDDDDDDVEVIVEYNPEEDEEEDIYDEEDEYMEDDSSDIDFVVPLSELMNQMEGPLTAPIEEIVPDCTVGGKNNKLSLSSENIEVSLEDPEYPQGVTIQPKKNTVNPVMDEKDVDKVVEDMADVLQENLGTIITKDVLKKNQEELVEKSTIEENKKTYEKPVILQESQVVEEPTVEGEKVDEPETEESEYNPDDYTGIVVNGKPVKELE